MAEQPAFNMHWLNGRIWAPPRLQVIRFWRVGSTEKIGIFTLLLVNIGVLGTTICIMLLSKRTIAPLRLPFGTLPLPLSLVSIGLFIICSIALGVSKITVSFDQRLTIIAPSIPDREFKEWNARWAKMKGIDDYRLIVRDLDKRGFELKIELPKQIEAI